MELTREVRRCLRILCAIYGSMPVFHYGDTPVFSTVLDMDDSRRFPASPGTHWQYLVM